MVRQVHFDPKQCKMHGNVRARRIRTRKYVKTIVEPGLAAYCTRAQVHATFNDRDERVLLLLLAALWLCKLHNALCLFLGSSRCVGNVWRTPIELVL